MSLELDARQRAMLLEMGVTVWAPAPAAAPAAPPTNEAAPVTRPAPAATPARPAAQAAAAPPPTTRRQAPTQAAAPTPAAAMAQAGGLLLRPPIALYPQADPTATPPELSSGWLVLLECTQPGDPLAGNAGVLLDNMLRAMGLHHRPDTSIAAVLRPPARPDAHPGPAAGQASLEQTLARLQPSMVLLLGLGAARAVLGSQGQTLAQLRAGSHRLADGTPAVVSHDPAYLLRAPQAKAATWLDLSRALALARGATPHNSNTQGS